MCVSVVFYVSMLFLVIQTYRPGIEPGAIAWKATMLPVVFLFVSIVVSISSLIA